LVAASRASAGDSWQSPYDNALHKVRIAAFAAATPGRKWQATTINAAARWQDAFNNDNNNGAAISAVGLMTDTDDTGASARVRYGEIIISDSPESPF
jgi:hypothetical protein